MKIISFTSNLEVVKINNILVAYVPHIGAFDNVGIVRVLSFSSNVFIIGIDERIFKYSFLYNDVLNSSRNIWYNWLIRFDVDVRFCNRIW